MDQNNSSNQQNNNAPHVDNDKGMAIVAYIIFFIPLIVGHASPFVKYHTNQGLNLFLFVVIGNIISGVIPVIGWFLILPLVNIAALIFLIKGILTASNNKMEPLPLIGKFQFIK